MSAGSWSHCILGFSRCLSWLGHVAAMEEFTFAKNLTKTRDCLSSNFEVVPTPFSRFFIANTLHHRLLACLLLYRTGYVTGSNLVAFVSHWLCDGVELGSALESVERAGRSTFPTPSPAWRERAGVRVSPSTNSSGATLVCTAASCSLSLP